MEDKLSKKLDMAMIAVAVVVIGVIGWQYAKSRQPPPATDEASVPSASSEAPVTDEVPALESMEKVMLAAGFESWTPEAKLEDEKVRSLTLVVKGNVAEAYLSARVTSEGKAFTKWDSLYFKLNDAGGHLFRPQSLEASEGEGTALLYGLYDVPYLPSVPYSEEREPERVNLLEMLAPGARVYLTSFISSLKPGRIEELALHYRCAEGDACQIAIK